LSRLFCGWKANGCVALLSSLLSRSRISFSNSVHIHILIEVPVTSQSKVTFGKGRFPLLSLVPWCLTCRYVLEKVNFFVVVWPRQPATLSELDSVLFTHLALACVFVPVFPISSLFQSFFSFGVLFPPFQTHLHFILKP
jgi:hypothetical protein